MNRVGRSMPLTSAADFEIPKHIRTEKTVIA